MPLSGKGAFVDEFRVDAEGTFVETLSDRVGVGWMRIAILPVDPPWFPQNHG